jgi:hypothetical protein
MATKVPAHYTSQSCVKCGHTSKLNRPNKGLLFRCECCGYELHSDLLGSRNIALRTLIVRQDWMSTGTLSMCLPGVGWWNPSWNPAKVLRVAVEPWCKLPLYCEPSGETIIGFTQVGAETGFFSESAGGNASFRKKTRFLWSECVSPESVAGNLPFRKQL